MKTDFSLNVKIDIGLTPEVVALVNSIIGERKSISEKEPAAQQEEPETKKPEQQSEQKEKKTKQKPEQKTEPQPEAAQQPEPEQAKKLTAVDIREAIHKTRLRIEGEDYQNNTESEKYKKYHRTLTAAFKNLASILGSDKPSNLPEDKIQAFINECDQLEIQKDGTIGKSLAF